MPVRICLSSGKHWIDIPLVLPGTPKRGTAVFFHFRFYSSPGLGKLERIKEVKALAAPFYSTACPAILRPGRATPGDAPQGVSAYSSSIRA